MVSVSTFFLLLSALLVIVSAAPSGTSKHKSSSKSKCQGFRLTSPTKFFDTTAGQCYQVSYDFNGNPPSHPNWITVELRESGSGNVLVETLVDKETITTTSIATRWFNMNLGKSHKSGDYFYRIYYGTECTIDTHDFHVDWNKNSAMEDCTKI